MSYYSQSQQDFGTQQSSISVLASQSRRTETIFENHIKDYKEMGISLAMRLERGGKIEQLFGTNFAQECREKLKALATDNVTKERQLKAYVNAYKAVTDQASLQQTQNNSQNDQENKYKDNNSNNANTSSANEYKEQIKAEYDRALQQIETNSLKITQEPAYLAIVKNLGEDQNDNEDDDLLLVANPNSSSSSGNNNTLGIKCPLTMALMEDPVRSKVCKHSFGRDAIYEYLRKGKSPKKCPVPGCINGNMTLNELEDDPETRLRVKRYKKRESASKQKLAAEATTVMDEDQDEDDLF